MTYTFGEEIFPIDNGVLTTTLEDGSTITITKVNGDTNYSEGARGSMWTTKGDITFTFNIVSTKPLNTITFTTKQQYMRYVSPFMQGSYYVDITSQNATSIPPFASRKGSKTRQFEDTFTYPESMNDFVYEDTITYVVHEVKSDKTGIFGFSWNPVTAVVVSSYNLNFIVDGEVVESHSYFPGETVSYTPSTPSKTGYDFTGWDASIPSTMPENDVNINAQFSVHQHTITYKVDGTTYDTQTYNYGAAVTAPANPSKYGYNFTGWNPVIPATMPDNDIITNAQFEEAIQYNVVYKVDNATYTTQSYYAGEAIIAPSNPSKTGYTFTAWNPALPASMPDNDIETSAQFNINSHTITYKVDNAVYTTQTYDYGA